MDDVGRLIQHAGAREAVPTERLERARQQVRAHWEQVVAESQPRKRPRRLNIVAIAASVALAAGLSFVLWNLANAPQAIATASVERILGAVSVANEAATMGGVIDGDTLIETGSGGRIALRMAGGQSLRVDTSSHLVVHSPTHVSLDAGAIYIDTAMAAVAEPILVSTPMGTARDIGTQFQVRLTATALLVGVRDGLVQVAQVDGRRLSVDKGRFVELDPDGETIERLLQNDDPSWSWIETVVPEFEIEGASLEQYLLWYAHEHGVTLRWTDSESEINARMSMLSGSLAGASLNEGLLIVKQVAPFDHRFDDDILWVRVE